MPQPKDVGGRGAAVMMRSGAHLHMHPMACPWQGEGDSFEVARQTPSTWHNLLRRGTDLTQKDICGGSFTYATTTHARDLQDFSISPSLALGNPPKLCS